MLRKLWCNYVFLNLSGIKKIIIALFFSTFCTASAQSQTKSYANQIGFKSDNDSYLAIKLDRYYTNGIEFFFIHALKNNNKTDSSNFYKKIWGLNIGQKIYTSRSGKTSNINRVDRPITAYLYASAYVQWLLKNETVYKAELQMGTIGANALGQQTQNFIHNTFGFYKIDGWQFQLNNQVGVNLNLDFQKLLYRTKNKKTDVALPLNIKFGNTFAGINAGLLFRFGKSNPFYQSAATQSTVANVSQKTINGKEFYLFAKPSLELIWHNATIEGGLFNVNKGPVFYNIKPVVLMQEVGAVYTLNQWAFILGVTFRTKEVESWANPHKYGSITLCYNFK